MKPSRNAVAWRAKIFERMGSKSAMWGVGATVAGFSAAAAGLAAASLANAAGAPYSTGASARTVKQRSRRIFIMESGDGKQRGHFKQTRYGDIICSRNPDR
jgi:hypothetical protein